jgi:hypothetical protein
MPRGADPTAFARCYGPSGAGIMEPGEVRIGSELDGPRLDPTAPEPLEPNPRGPR